MPPITWHGEIPIYTQKFANTSLVITIVRVSNLRQYSDSAKLLFHKEEAVHPVFTKVS